MDQQGPARNITDEALVRRMMAGDPSALVGLYDRHAGSVFGFLLRSLGDRSLAEEILHEVFLFAWRQAGNLRPESDRPVQWLLTTAWTLALHEIRRSRRPSPQLAVAMSGIERTFVEESWLHDSQGHGRGADQSGQVDAERESLVATKEALIDEVETFLRQTRAESVFAPDRAPALQPSFRNLIRYLDDALGAGLTAIALGAASVEEVEHWAREGTSPAPDLQRRIRNAFGITELLLRIEPPEAIRGWFLGMNPELDDRAPALVIVDEPDLVLAAARNFAATG